MKKLLIIFISILSFSCTNKDSEYWVTPANQNGDMTDFYATPEYCDHLINNCPEFENLKRLEKEVIGIVKNLRTLPSPSKTVKYTLETIEQTEFVSNELALACGGFCITETSLPVLPYRTAELKVFTEHNLDGYQSIINKHIDYLESNSQIKLDREKKTLLNKVDTIKNQNVIGALIKFYEIELQLLEINKTLANTK